MTRPNERLKRNAFFGALLRSAGLRNFGIERTPTGLSVFGKETAHIPYSALANLPALQGRMGFTAIKLTLKNTAPITVAGLPTRAAREFLALTHEELQRIIEEAFERALPDIEAVCEAFAALQEPRFYPSACKFVAALEKAQKIPETLPPLLADSLLTADQRSRLDAVLAFEGELQARRDEAARLFMKQELHQFCEFLDTIEAKPLTPEQRRAVVTDEDATLVLAGAGSGKTSVIVAKASYLMKRGIREPNEILLLAFGKEAASEMARRIQDRSGAHVDALTFHALGNRIIREVEGRGPPLSVYASDEVKCRALLREILSNNVAKDPQLANVLMRWFSEFYWPYKSQWDFKSLDEYYQWIEAHELRALSGDLVKSHEELLIANWLYCQGLKFEYEPLYEASLPTDARGAYRPDFRLSESGVYIEHFGVRKVRGPDGWSTRLMTAPFVDRERYLRDMSWKREVHQKNGTILIETFSYEQTEGRLLKALEDKIKPFAELRPLPEGDIFQKLIEMGLIDAFTQTLITFLRHFKSAGASLEDCRQRAEKHSDTQRCQGFLMIFERVLEAYQRELADQIDFEDMINRAADYIEEGAYRSPYRHILVDEFQDISAGRARLLRALKAQHSDARIFAVGDDWQSIFRFAGSDIHIMRHFGEEFGGQLGEKTGIHSTIDLGRTFRSTEEIAQAARLFVLKNPSQIKKEVKTAHASRKPCIKVAYVERSQERQKLKSVLRELSSQSGGDQSVLLLGRYNYLKPERLEELTEGLPNLSLDFMTVHGSKGLEADHVVLLGASSGKMGFPSEITDDPVLDLIMPEPEGFEHAEERRLFYVALTRARWSVTMLADRERPSAFVRELLSSPEYGITASGHQTGAERRCYECTGRMLVRETKAGSVNFICEHQPLCPTTQAGCPHCKSDVPTRSVMDEDVFVCSCQAQFPPCPACSNGWLVARKGRYGEFLGCVYYPSCTGKNNSMEKSRN